MNLRDYREALENIGLAMQELILSNAAQDPHVSLSELRSLAEFAGQFSR